ncbi:MAG TPA: glutamate synthase subunit beta [bacterium]|nr:glutamate synthase subunit beta [bacterium]HQL63365.1 glutamate synthase subunit beta [bacterium]
MPKPTGFLEYTREDAPKRPVEVRVRDFREIEEFLPWDRVERQAARCMDCGIPFCHVYGCPVKNRMPDFNELVYRRQWRRALDILHSTNNFPEITGRICPAPCEAACTLSIHQPPVAIRLIELEIVERGWREGWIQPQPAEERTGKKVAIVGSGPAGLAAAQQLGRNGHEVVVFEKADRIGGILRYGIPDFKLEKWILDRRLNQMREEGVRFETGVDAGTDLSPRYLQRTFDAILITAGASRPRDLNIPGRDLGGIHFAMDFLVQQNKRNAGDRIPKEQEILASGKKVVVIGGGDTGSDCVGTSRRQGAIDICQIEILPKPADVRPADNPWPVWPKVLKTSTSHEEGCTRLWSILTREFLGEGGQVKKLHCVKLEWTDTGQSGKPAFREIPGSDFELNADLVLLSLGFLHTEHGPLVEGLKISADNAGNLAVQEGHRTSVPGIFAAGDCVLGASLVVRAIMQGREAAADVDRYLMGKENY